MEPLRGLGIFLVLLLLLLLPAGPTHAAQVPPESSLELKPLTQVGDGQAVPKVPPQNQPLLSRRRRHSSHFPLCSFCCNCCGNRGCGFCCRT
ncbi:hepcidin isoform X2 [Myiozetetes cayanensis]|uniref:hepcidin isoform X2 n=1 Tax=Myiozetetes cayanensis TaxID=478635 RepID=UPI00215F70D2|nr:hepcidin isoform X2 [Myiozetetes cayanensis]